MNYESKIREKLAILKPQKLDIFDKSSNHIGHKGARKDSGHYDIVIISSEFSGKNLLERHRAIYEALGDMMHKEIHALSIKAYTPEEQ